MHILLMHLISRSCNWQTPDRRLLFNHSTSSTICVQTIWWAQIHRHFWKHISTSSWSFSRSLGLFFNVVISFWRNQWLVTLHPCLANQVQHNHPLSHGTFAPWTASRGFCFSGHSKESTCNITQPHVFDFSCFHIGNSESLQANLWYESVLVTDILYGHDEGYWKGQTIGILQSL